jgi:hypothetical protein
MICKKPPPPKAVAFILATLNALRIGYLLRQPGKITEELSKSYG